MVVRITVEDSERPNLSLHLSSDEDAMAWHIAKTILKMVETYRILSMELRK